MFIYVRLGSYYMNSLGEWTTTPTFIQFIIYGNEPASGNVITKTFNISSAALPITGNVYVEINAAKWGSVLTNPENATFAEVSNLDLSNTFTGDNTEGEFHTVSRIVKVSSIVKENKSVSNGDNSGIIYLGAIFKDDGITTTQTWSRKGSFESFPLCRIAAEEELRIGQKPLKIFNGSIFGYMPYLSFISINNVQGKFFPIEYSYNTKTNIIDFKLLELYSAEITDILYKFTFDYGNTVKPTITS